MLPITTSTASTTTTIQPPPSSSTTSSLAASRPRRSSSNTHNHNNTISTSGGGGGTRSTSMNRHSSRSRGYSNTTSTSPYSPYSSSPSSHIPSSSLDKRQQSKFERLFGSSSNGSNGSNANGHSATASPSSSNTALYGTSPSSSALSSSSTPPIPPHSLRSTSASASASSGIALTRRAAAAAAVATQQRGIGGNYSNGHTADIHDGVTSTSTEQDDEEDDDEQPAVFEYSSSPGGGATATKLGSNNNSLGLGGLHNNNNIKKISSTNGSSSSNSKKDEKLLRCERCHKVYHHPQSLIKHRWQHTEIWSDASRYGLSKHATVQALEAAVILANPDTLRLLPNDRSHWPAAVSPPTSGLLGSERVNIEVLRKQAEVNERELDEQEKAGNLRKGPPTVSSAQARRATANMQVYSKSMPAHVGRRRSGLAFSLHNDMMDEEDDDDDDEDSTNDIKDDATMTTETNDERGEDGDEDNDNNDNDDDSTESEDEAVIAGMNVKNGPAASTELESMDQDMFSLDISSSSPYARASPLPPVSENGTSIIPTSTRSGLSYSRKNYTTSLIAPLTAERYTFLPTIPSSSSLHISEHNMSANMTAIPSGSSASVRTRNRSSSHTRSTRAFGEAQDRSTRENSTSSSTDESGVSATASVGAGTTGGSGDDESVSHATKDSGYISVTAQDMKSESSSQQHAPAYAQQHQEAITTPHRPAIDPAQTATISMSAPVLGFFTERSPVSSFSNRGSGAPTTRQQAGHASPRFGPVDNSPVKADFAAAEGTNGPGHQHSHNGTTAQAIPGYTPLEAQAAEILSSSHQSQSGPRSFSQTHFGSAYARSPGYHPYRSPSPFPSSRQLPSSSLSQAQQQSNNIHSSSPSTTAATTGQAYSFGQAPLGTSYRSTSFNLASPAPALPKQFPMSPLARPADTIDGANDDDDDEMMDMDL